jgi:precorrin-2 dehydrogenase / sirohydrochlorin ferrochelatase
MIPVLLDPARLKVVVVGRGEPLARRLEKLREAGATDVRVLAAPPSAEALAGVRLVFAAGLDREEATAVSDAAHRAGALVHVEDMPTLSDLHAPASVRRGDLVITVSTNGRSPGLASRLRRWIEDRLTDEWATAVDDLSRNRRIWREAGLRYDEVARRTDEWIDRAGLLAGPALAPPTLPPERSSPCL